MCFLRDAVGGSGIEKMTGNGCVANGGQKGVLRRRNRSLLAWIVDILSDGGIMWTNGAAAWAMAARALRIKLRAVSYLLAAPVVLPDKQGYDADDYERESIQIEICYNTYHGLHPLSVIGITKTDQRVFSRPPISGSELIIYGK